MLRCEVRARLDLKIYINMIDKEISTVGLEAVKQGGRILVEGFGKAQNISYKGAIDLVTEMDRRSEDSIIAILKREFPDCGILAEESDERQGDGSCRWILDPLDGTTNYAHGYPFFSVSLAFEKDEKIVWGVIYDPLRQEVFSAELGKGATLNQKPITVSKIDSLSKGFLATGFPYDVRESEENNLNHFNNFEKVAQAIRRDGSAALDLCYVAMGRFDGFWELKLHPWDTAAGSLIVTEAGGRITDFKAGPFTINGLEILATNGLIHNEMVKVLCQT